MDYFLLHDMFWSNNRSDAGGAMKTNRFLYYFSLVFPMAMTPVIFMFLFSGAAHTELIGIVDHVLFYSKFFWFTGAWFVVSNFLGFMFGDVTKTDEENLENYYWFQDWNPDKKLLITYVSRGDNDEALRRSIKKTAFILFKMNVKATIEVVTDIPLTWEPQFPFQDKIKYHVVPSDYRTEKDAKYKARALHYLLEQRKPQPNAWILHLDEESCLTKSAVVGIHKFIHDPENSNTVGQGEIQYNSHNYGEHFLNTITDSVRAGDDLGRFRFQYKMVGKPLFGMHGSFILVPEHIERLIGFDLGGRGSITEDAYFALISSDNGYKFGWVDGHIQEQSPFSLMAIIKQRRRWFCGLWLLSFDPVISLKTRFPLMINTILWSVAWIGPIVTFANIALGGGYFPLPLMILAAIIQGGYASVYLVGAYRNLVGVEMPLWKKLSIYFGTYLLLPISSLIEGIAILYALISPVKTFDVVKK